MMHGYFGISHCSEGYVELRAIYEEFDINSVRKLYEIQRKKKMKKGMYLCRYDYNRFRIGTIRLSILQLDFHLKKREKEYRKSTFDLFLGGVGCIFLFSRSFLFFSLLSISNSICFFPESDNNIFIL